MGILIDEPNFLQEFIQRIITDDLDDSCSFLNSSLSEERRGDLYFSPLLEHSCGHEKERRP